MTYTGVDDIKFMVHGRVFSGVEVVKVLSSLMSLFGDKFDVEILTTAAARRTIVDAYNLTTEAFRD